MEKQKRQEEEVRRQQEELQRLMEQEVSSTPLIPSVL
jgi:hypothetical protein